MSILTQADVKRAGAKTGTLSADDLLLLAEIQAGVDVVVERIVGPVATGSRTWTGKTRSGSIVLPWPFTSITSVTVDGVTVPAGQYDAADGPSGILYNALGYSAWSGGSRVTVVATAGTATVAGNVKMAAMALARHWWQLSAAGGRLQWADNDGVPTDAGVPKVVRDQLMASTILPGIG